jgi:hypothetical protein
MPIGSISPQMTKYLLFLRSMERKVRWTNRALGRLGEIADYIVKDNPERRVNRSPS